MKFSVYNSITQSKTILNESDLLSSFALGGSQDSLKLLLRTGYKDANNRDFTEGDLVQNLEDGKLFILRFGHYCGHNHAMVDMNEGYGLHFESLDLPLTTFPFKLSEITNLMIVGDIMHCPGILRVREKPYLELKFRGFNDWILKEKPVSVKGAK